MIKKQIIHLKNVIVFKVLIYFLISIFFFVLFPILNSQLRYAIDATENSKVKLQDLENKLVFVNDERKTIQDSYKKYLEIKQQKIDFTCFIKQNLHESYLTLANQIGMDTKPMLYSSPTPLVEKFNNNKNIEILTTNLASIFMSKTFAESIVFIEKLYCMLPEYSIINNIDINMEELITPETLIRLSPDITPSLIKNKVNMQIRKVHIVTD